jgi:hypothetical protein
MKGRQRKGKVDEGKGGGREVWMKGRQRKGKVDEGKAKEGKGG